MTTHKTIYEGWSAFFSIWMENCSSRGIWVTYLFDLTPIMISIAPYIYIAGPRQWYWLHLVAIVGLVTGADGWHLKITMVVLDYILFTNISSRPYFFKSKKILRAISSSLGFPLMDSMYPVPQWLPRSIKTVWCCSNIIRHFSPPKFNCQSLSLL